jgi:N-acetylneuraminic acid mutarotase
LGTAASGNVPGGRISTSQWIDGSDNLWLFGGVGYDSTGENGALNDLWEFKSSSSDWGWMGGSSTIGISGQPGVYGTLGTAATGNIPGSRSESVSWTDSSSHFWLFGGSGNDVNGTAGYLNDLWEYYPATNEWEWVGGSSTVPGSGEGQSGVYGTLGTAAPGNIPGGRDEATSWIDNNGHFWLFGGEGYDSTDALGALNDFWEYFPATNEWAWMGGSSTIGSGHSGTYGTLGTPALTNIPGSRYDALSWTDSKGNLWLFGGYGKDANGSTGALNDLWVFSPTTTEWAWIGGSSTVGNNGGQSGVYGTLGTAASANIPGSRYSAATWTDSSGNLWLIGGQGYDANGKLGFLNDLWEYQPAIAAGTATFTVSAAAASPASIAPGATATSTVTVSTTNGYAGTVTLTCALTQSPSGATDPPTCSGGSSTVTLSSGTTSGTATVTVSTTAPSSSSAFTRPRPGNGKGWGGAGGGAVLAFLILLGIPARRRIWRSMLGAVALMAVLGGLAGCGDFWEAPSSGTSSSDKGTTAGSYTFTVTGTGDPAVTPAPTSTFTVTVT